MLKWFVSWWNGENIEVEVIECRKKYNDSNFDHTLIQCPDGFRRYVLGHLGKPGDKIIVNTWDLGQYE